MLVVDGDDFLHEVVERHRKGVDRCHIKSWAHYRTAAAIHLVASEEHLT